ncbi:MAG: hypothetical protein H6817_00205 [Phycisphaerales bacterium]|nr:hypothetical protein [Phycisphaerales bacterium]
MQNRRPALIAFSVIGLIVAVIIAWPFLRGAPGPETEFTMVCVATGEVFTLDVDEVGMVPARNPKTGERTLVPCVRDDDGTLHVAERYAGALTGELAEVNRVVDVDTLRVRSGP